MKKAGVNMAKNKVKVEYDVDMEKERRKKQQKTENQDLLSADQTFFCMGCCSLWKCCFIIS